MSFLDHCVTPPADLTKGSLLPRKFFFLETRSGWGAASVGGRKCVVHQMPMTFDSSELHMTLSCLGMSSIPA